MPAPSPSAIVENPPPLNPFQQWPFVINEFPAYDLLIQGGGDPQTDPKAPEPNPARKEAA